MVEFDVYFKNMDPFFENDDDIFEDYIDEYVNGPDNFEYDDLYDDVGDDYDYDAWHVNCPCRPLHEVLDSYAPKMKSIDNICHIDVFNVSHHFTKLVEVIEAESKDQLHDEELGLIGLCILKELAEKAEKLEQKMKYCLEEQLKNVLKLPNTAVMKILEFLLDYSIYSNDWEVIKFEENNHEGYRRILANAHDYFVRIVEIVRLKIVEYSCAYHMLMLDVPDLVSEVVSLVNYMEEDKVDWQTYFGIRSGVKTSREEFDFWEDICDLGDAFEEMFVEEWNIQLNLNLILMLMLMLNTFWNTFW